MSQASLVLPTTGTLPGLTAVTDINAALDALVTSNSGASAPTNASGGVPELGQLWLNTTPTPDQWNIYDGSGWVLIGSLGAGHVFIPAAAPATPGAITGMLPSSMTGTSTTAAMTVSAGAAADSTGASNLVLTSKSWAVSHGNAALGYQGGTTLPNSSTIHMFVCSGGSGVTVFASTSLAPTLPTGFTSFFRRIFSFTTDAGGAPLPYVADEIAGGAYAAWLATSIGDVVGGGVGTASRTLYPLSVPLGIKVEVQARMTMAGTGRIKVTSMDEPDLSLGTGDLSNPGSSVPSASGIGGKRLITDTSAQVGVRGSAGGLTVTIETAGWIDNRRS